MIDNDVEVKVHNITNQTVVYTIDEDNVRRRFNAFEAKTLTAEELRKLYYVRGGAYLLQEYLCVENEELAGEFGVPSDMIEYYWTKQDVDRVLEKEPLEVLEDALEFGPDGIKELIKDRAIALHISDLTKREAIDRFLGINISSMINIYDEYNEPTEEKPTTGRRVRPQSSVEQATGRRVKQE